MSGYLASSAVVSTTGDVVTVIGSSSIFATSTVVAVLTVAPAALLSHETVMVPCPSASSVVGPVGFAGSARVVPVASSVSV